MNFTLNLKSHLKKINKSLLIICTSLKKNLIYNIAVIHLTNF